MVAEAVPAAAGGRGLWLRTAMAVALACAHGAAPRDLGDFASRCPVPVEGVMVHASEVPGGAAF